jgi:hypothetical protein
MSRHRAAAKGSAATALAIWLLAAAVSFGFAAAPSFAEESGATEVPVTETDQETEGPATAEGEASQGLDPEPTASPSSARPRSRVLRPDPSDVADPLWESGPDGQEARGTPGAEGVIGCMAGCLETPSGTMLRHGGGSAPGQAAVEPLAPTGDIVCVAGC